MEKNNSDVILYDVETIYLANDIQGGWKNIEKMLMSSAVAYSTKSKRYHFFLHDRRKDDLAKFLHGKRCISWNGVKFDSRIILGDDRVVEDAGNGLSFNIYTPDKKYFWRELDLLLPCIAHQHSIELSESVKRFSKGGLKLDDVSMNTVGVSKSGDGMLAPTLYREKKYDELLEYNLQDVIVLKELYEYWEEHHHIIDGKGNTIPIGKQKE